MRESIWKCSSSTERAWERVQRKLKRATHMAARQLDDRLARGVDVLAHGAVVARADARLAIARLARCVGGAHLDARQRGAHALGRRARLRLKLVHQACDDAVEPLALRLARRRAAAEASAGGAEEAAEAGFRERGEHLLHVLVVGEGRAGGARAAGGRHPDAHGAEASGQLVAPALAAGRVGGAVLQGVEGRHES